MVASGRISVRAIGVEERGDRVYERDPFSLDAGDVADAQNGRDVVLESFDPLGGRG